VPSDLAPVFFEQLPVHARNLIINWVCPIVVLVKENPFNICATIDTSITQQTFELFSSTIGF
jgi:hypothetical protein